MGINTNVPSAVLDSNGAIKIGLGTESCTTGNAGMIKAITDQDLTCICGCYGYSTGRLSLTFDDAGRCEDMCTHLKIFNCPVLSDPNAEYWTSSPTYTGVINGGIWNIPDVSWSNTATPKADNHCPFKCKDGYNRYPSDGVCKSLDSEINYCPGGNHTPQLSQSVVVSSNSFKDFLTPASSGGTSSAIKI